MLTDNLFENSMKAAGIFSSVARNLKWRMKFEDVLPFLFRPYGKAWNNGRACLSRDFREGDVGASRGAKEIDKDAFLERSVLID